MTYTGKHRDDTPAARTECDRRDLQASVTWACQHHQPRHSAFVAKVREVAA